MLEVAQDATLLEIKKSYFKLVRQYPPDNFPDEFIKIRKAYETLIEPKSRQEYDKLVSLPLEAKKQFEMAVKYEKSGEFYKAIEVLYKIKDEYGYFSVVELQLAGLYSKTDQRNKAIDIYKELTEKNPENASFWLYLGEAYTARNWLKKAEAAIECSIKLDSDNVSAWLAILNCCKNLKNHQKALEKMEQVFMHFDNDEKFEPSIYVKAIEIFAFNKDLHTTLKKVEYLKRRFSDKHKELESIAHSIVNNVFKDITLSSVIFRIFVDCSYELSPGTPDVLKVKKFFDDNLHLLEKIESLEENKIIHPCIIDNLKAKLFENNDFINEFIESIVVKSEEVMVFEPYKFKEFLKKLMVNYPVIYKINYSFYDMVVNYTDSQYLRINYLLKNLDKVKKYSDIPEEVEEDIREVQKNPSEYRFNDDDYAETFTTAPKIGRNDPCPCGSGKKFKKCCG